MHYRAWENRPQVSRPRAIKPVTNARARAHERLVAKLASGTPYGIAAVLWRVSTGDQQDGYTWSFLVSDGSRTGELEASVSASTFDEVDPHKTAALHMEEVIERLSVRYPAKTRLADLISERRLTLAPADFAF
jgi:hypothetical protein